MSTPAILRHEENGMKVLAFPGRNDNTKDGQLFALRVTEETGDRTAICHCLSLSLSFLSAFPFYVFFHSGFWRRWVEADGRKLGRVLNCYDRFSAGYLQHRRGA
jgi:hypothetical protein